MNPKTGEEKGIFSPKNNIPLFFLQDEGLIDAGHESSDFDPPGDSFLLPSTLWAFFSRIRRACRSAKPPMRNGWVFELICQHRICIRDLH